MLAPRPRGIWHAHTAMPAKMACRGSGAMARVAHPAGPERAIPTKAKHDAGTGTYARREARASRGRRHRSRLGLQRGSALNGVRRLTDKRRLAAGRAGWRLSGRVLGARSRGNPGRSKR